MGRGCAMGSEADEVVGLHLTRTQRELLRYIGGETALNGGISCTKRDLANLTGRNIKTIDRCLAGLRRDGLVEVEMRFSESGAQLANWYRATGGLARALADEHASIDEVKAREKGGLE